MPVIFDKRISEKGLSILHFLYKVRGATNLQIVKGIGYEQSIANIKNMYKPLNKLIKENLVDFLYLKNEERRFYFLSEEGYELMNGILDIPLNHIGSGYDNDYGDFNYKLHKPPTLQTKHFILQVDAIIEIENIKRGVAAENLNVKIDYRDNRYISTQFEVKKEGEAAVNGEIKPDCELMFSNYDLNGARISTNIYSIEIDTGSERRAKLLNKFEAYKLYLDYLISEKKPLPKGILFIGDVKERQMGLERRWGTLTEVFHQALESYADKVNLHYETLDNLQSMINRETLYREETRKLLGDISNSVLENPNFSGSSIYFFSKKNSRYDGVMPVTLYEPTVGKSVMYCYIRVDGYESLGWYQLRRFLEFFEKERTLDERYAKYKKIVPVVYFFNRPGPKLNPSFFKNYPLLQLDELIYFDGTKQRWYSQSMQEATTLPLPRR